jgi:hypothetical protein
MTEEEPGSNFTEAAAHQALSVVTYLTAVSRQ